jgi:hypothetical protein
MVAEEDTLADGVALVDTMVVDADGLALTTVLDGDALIVDEPVSVADTVGLGGTWLADGELVADTDAEKLANVDGVGVVVTAADVGKEDTLIDGEALIDTMLTVAEADIDSEGVVDGVSEGDIRLAEGELVTDADPLADGVALALTVVVDGVALGDNDGIVGADDALAVTDATLLLLLMLAVMEGVADWEGVK